MSTHDVILLESFERQTVHEDGFTTVRFSPGGDTHVAAVTAAVAAALADEGSVDIEAIAGEPVTILQAGSTMLGAQVVTARPGKILPTPGRGTGWMWLPKGARTKGFQLRPDTVIGWADGYNGVDTLRAAVQAMRARFPQVQELTAERFAALPPIEVSDDGSTPDCTLAVFGIWRGPGGETSPGAVWLCHSYDPEHDIVEGVLFVDPREGTSEYGSTYGRDLLRFGGEVVGFGSVSFATAIDWCEDDLGAIHARLLELVTA